MKTGLNEADYNELMAGIDALMAKGSQNISKEELEELQKMALAAQAYEQSKYVIDAPTSLVGMIEMKMFEMRLNQKELAKKLNISTTKLSLIMNGKQKADVTFLKAVYKTLHIDADFVLEHA
jgi:HTH-type transcriptional regulator/antitoxin HigA